MNDFSVQVIVLPCLHRHVVVDTIGGVHFSAGEVWDDIQERLLCLDCMEYVTEAEVRNVQNANYPNINQPIQMEVTHDHS
jgi:hypothetical protein